MARRKYNRSNGGRVRTKLPFIQNDICPPRTIQPLAIFSQRPKKVQTPFSPLQRRRRTGALTGNAGPTCLERLSGLSRLSAQRTRDESDALPQRTAGRSGLSPASLRLLSAHWTWSAVTTPPQRTAGRLDCAGRLRSSLCRPIRPEGLETGHLPPLYRRLDYARPSPTPLR